jgi:hypothetical protein
VRGVTNAAARQMMIRELLKRHAAVSYTLTDQGRRVLKALIMKAATRT